MYGLGQQDYTCGCQSVTVSWVERVLVIVSPTIPVQFQLEVPNNSSDLMASATIISLLIVVDESADADQCKQDGVTRCRGVIMNDLVLKTLGVGDKLDKLEMDKELRNLKKGDKLNLVAGESILMTLRRDTEVDKPDRLKIVGILILGIIGPKYQILRLSKSI